MHVILFVDRNEYGKIMSPPPPTKGEGGHINISFSADPRRQFRCLPDSLYPPYFLNQWVEFYQTCIDTSLGQAKELIKFW